LINSWQKKLSVTDLGLGGTHDKYLNIPKEDGTFTGTDQNPSEFYNREPGRPGRQNWIFINHVDKKTGENYEVRFEFAKKSKQTRLYKLAGFYNARKPKPGDEIVVEKITLDGETNFLVDITRNSISLPVLSKDEIIKSPKRNLVFKKKPEVNIFLEKINQPIYEKYRKGKSRRAEDIVPQAEIYEVVFKIDNKTFVYVGQDSYCSGPYYYFGSSILTDFCKLVYGEKIFKKKILHTLQNIKQKELNQKEWECIYNARSECKKKKWYCLNGEVQTHN
jgi:hypothetical protein